MLKICLYKAVYHQRPVETFMEARMKKKGKGKGKGKKKEREKERETTNSIIPSKQSKKNAGIHLYCWNIRHHSYLLKDVKHVKHLNMAHYDVKSNSG